MKWINPEITDTIYIIDEDWSGYEVRAKHSNGHKTKVHLSRSQYGAFENKLRSTGWRICFQ